MPKLESLKLRNRTVKGWAFFDHTEEEIRAIRKFLETGEREDLPESYKPLFDDQLATSR